MKFVIFFKSPDGVSDSVNEAAQNAILADKDEEFQEAFYNLSYTQRKEAIADVKDEIQEFISRWVEGSAYVAVEFNTDTQTAMVVPIKV